MFLKRLEIHGFKSFADRTVLTFQPGITAIVGPNGSGKSNIVDSLRWVMGEHNLRNLRGAKLEDIIFAGSEDRKPLGMADVTLVLDNSDHTFPLDFTEIAISRRFYRSGESEFLINKTPVRLKDIQELFFDTGLGKESYSIISQGKIDSLLSLKPEERRFVFEEAAGIMKYKNKKDITIKKLTDTENSLLRIEDILQELRTQMLPLSRQAEEAKVYLSIQQELKGLEVNYYHTELTRITEALSGLEQEKQETEEELTGLQKEEEKIEAEVLTLKQQISVLEEETEAKQKLLLSQATQKERALGELKLYDERDRFLKERKKETEEFLAQQRTRFLELENKKAELRRQAEEINEQKERFSTEIRSLEEKISAYETRLAEIRLRLTQEKTGLAQELERLSTLKQGVNESNLQNDYKKERAVELEDQLDLCHRELTELKANAEKVKSEMAAANDHLSALVRQEAEVTDELQKTRAYLTNQAEKNQEIRNQLRGVESKIALLEELEKNHGGYFQGVKALLQATREPFHEEIHGVVADLIQVEYGKEIALETALGSALQNLVISHDRYARAAIDFLKRHSLGRATFLPLNLIEQPPDRLDGVREILVQHGCKPATDAVRYDRKYQAVVYHLLGNTIIAPDLSAAVAVTQKTGKKFRLVTLDGDLVSPGGAITGGKTERKQSGPLVRKRDISELQKKKQDLLAFMDRGLQEEKKLQEKLSTLTTTLDQIKAQRQEVGFTINSLRKEAELITTNEERLLTQQKQLADGLAKIKSEILAQQSSISDLKELLAQAEADIDLRNITLKELEAEENNLLTEKEKHLRELSILSSKLAGIQQEWMGKAEYLKDQDLIQLNLTKETERRQNELAQIEEEISRLQAEKTALQQTIEVSEAKKAELEKDLETVKANWQAHLSESAEQEEKLRNIRRLSGTRTAELHRLELQTNRLRAEQEKIEAHLVEVYGETWQTGVCPDYPLPDNAKKEIEQLKRRLKEMEPVNLQAIEDYERQKERESFLSKQYDDLVSAKASLEKVITEIEKTIKRRFVETFEAIRKEFITLFEQLFSGGKADIKLLDEDNPLESGIEILAQPPGKRLQTLSLLSGGERAMTAISLLFAILKVKPAPFCLLDEIDATLDDANVKRFSNLLQMFSNDLQFIVITHRRGTMEMVGTLYGVTMEEKGVSKLISLDLKQAVS
ncbi:MAG TPA: chromosome segregation protein SMC [Bacillota bacterium]